MSKSKAFWMSLALAVVSVAAAPPAKADNVVVTPAQAAPAPAPAAAPTQTVITQPGQPAAAPAPIVEDRRRTEVRADVSPSRNYVGTIAVSALLGGLAGALIGGAIYYLDNQNHPANVAYWAAGGVLVGTGVGVAQLLVQESRVSAAVAHMPTDPAPTLRLALYRVDF